MKTFTNLRNLYGTITNDSSSANLTFGDEIMNDTMRRVCAERDWDFLQKTATSTTVASTQFYNLPFDYETLIDVSITSGTTVYVPKECPTREVWDLLNQNTNITSNVPEWFFIFNKQVGFYPTPSANGNTITFTFDRRVIDLNAADYTTGTLSATNGSTTLTGSGTTWTAPMAGRAIKITASDVAASSGDGFWYEISSVGSATSITLTRAYNGTSLTGGSYTIGQVSVLPESYQDLPVYKAAEIYFTSQMPDKARAELYRNIYMSMHAGLVADFSSKSVNPLVEDDESRRLVNPNLFINL